MGTTTIIVELLIIGIQTIIWISMLIISVFGCDLLLDIFQNVKDYMNIFIILLFSFAYTLGIILDRIADFLYNIINPKHYILKYPFIEKVFNKTHSDNKMLMLCYEKKSFDFLDYVRSRIRILRATSLNLLFYLIIGSVFIITNSAIQSKYLTLGIYFFFSVLSIFLTFLSLGSLQTTYDNRLKQLYELLLDKHGCNPI